MLCRKKDEGPDGTLYAMKTLRKRDLIKRNQLGHTQAERRILQEVRHPFLVHIVFAFQTDDKLYMVLEYMGGGELFHWLKKKRKFSEDGTRLYAAEIALGLGHLHGLDIIYRDLKPENILLDTEGHLRITDFGLSKEGVSSADGTSGTKTFCGTPEYLAPEVLENKPHGKAVDWWSFGTLVYELMCGLPPFYDQNTQRMYQKIQHAPLRFPSQVSADSRAFLTGLLNRTINARLGSNGDIEELKAHAFFAPLDFEQVMAKTYPAEIQPSDKILNFDEEFTSQKAVDSVVTTTLSETQKNKTQFEGFTFNEGAIAEGEEE